MGTVFVNSLANTLVSIGTSVKLSLKVNPKLQPKADSIVTASNCQLISHIPTHMSSMHCHTVYQRGKVSDSTIQPAAMAAEQSGSDDRDGCHCVSWGSAVRTAKGRVSTVV